MYKHRTYIENSNDFEKMVGFITVLVSQNIDDWSVGRLYAWRYGRWDENLQNDKAFEKQAELFFNDNEDLCGIVITENFGNDFYILSLKDELLISQMVDFLAEKRFNKDYVVIASENNKMQRKILVQNGYAEFENADTTYNYALSNIVYPQINIPYGFSLTNQKQYTDQEAVEKQRFFSFNPNTEYNAIIDRAYKYSRKNSLLIPDLNIVLLDNQNKPVSSCMGYLDKFNKHIEIEVVCTLESHKNRGFAKIVISDCIRQGIVFGAKKFSISAWEDKTRHLYSSFGNPEVVQKIKYKK